jgi:predicted metalloprotease with PDZ domain
MQVKNTFATLSLTCLLLAALPAAPVVAASPDVSAPESGTSPQPAKKRARVYGLDYEANFLPEQGTVRMRIGVRQKSALLRQVSFSIDPARYRAFEAEGEMEVTEDRVTWRPPADGGTLAFEVVLNHQRKSGSYDSLLTGEWAVFRGDDLFPPAAVKAAKGARSRSRLRLDGPEDWSLITAYPRDDKDPEWFRVEWAERHFDRPVGWMAAGALGARWTRIGDRRIGVAGPLGQGVRHLDILAFLRWNLPELVKVFPGFPMRALVVSAGDPMWRGGLSGPASLYLHADRPLISGNSTSTLLHELVHVAQSYRAAKDEDWIVEGIAEYYTLEIMRRSGTISEKRYERGVNQLDEWANESSTLQAAKSSGPRTAKGVTVIRELDAELRERSGGRHSLDDVARQLAEDGKPVTTERLREIAAQLAGAPVESISPERLGSR